MALNFTFHSPGLFTKVSPLGLTETVETKYIDVKIYPIFYKQIVVEFSIPSAWGSCKFNIFRSETNVAPWVQINQVPVTGTFFKDTTTHDFSKFMHGWYIVECVLPDGRKVQSIPTTWIQPRNSWVELRAVEIQRREMLLLSKFTGIKSLVFRRKHYGKRCSNCWDFASERVTKDHCQVCLGTSFEGGYFTGFETLIQYDVTNNTSAFNYKGRDEKNTINGWTISVPIIDTFDLVLRVPDMSLYRVDYGQVTELQTQTVRQVLQLTELPKDSIEFKLAAAAIPEGYLT